MTKAMFAQGINILSFNLQPTILGHFHTGVVFLFFFQKTELKFSVPFLTKSGIVANRTGAWSKVVFL